MKRLTLIISLFILLGFTSIGGANPGGVGDGNFDMQCGGACHGDSSQNQTSPVSLDLVVDSTPYVGLPVSLTATVSGVQFNSADKIGLFLLTDTTGHSDMPIDSDWNVISDINGGTNNYVEIEASSFTDEYTVSWTVTPTNTDETKFYLSIHHGGSDVPYFAISSGTIVTPLPVPENLPRLANDFTPQISRELGDITVMLVETVDVNNLQIEWQLIDGDTQFANATLNDEGNWVFELPIALQPSIIEWRAIMEGEGPTQVTPWFRIAAQEPVLKIDQAQLYTQSFAFCIFFVGLVLTLHNRFSKGHEEVTLSEIGKAIPSVHGENTDHPDLPDGQLPEGWTMEQWKWYGQDYLEGKL